MKKQVLFVIGMLKDFTMPLPTEIRMDEETGAATTKRWKEFAPA
jgi:hypothetical protein